MATNYPPGRTIYTYPSGWLCQHCGWLQNDYSRFSDRVPRVGLPVWICRDTNTRGASAFIASNKYAYAFNLVLGRKDQPEKHSSTDFRSLLICLTQFIEQLYIRYGISNVRVLINSHYSKTTYQEKEHLHAWVAMNSKEDEALYAKNYGRSRSDALLPAGPYPNEQQVEITAEEGRELIRMTDPKEFLAKKIGKTVGELDKKSFYLFMNFTCGGNRECSYIRGKIAY